MSPLLGSRIVGGLELRGGKRLGSTTTLETSSEAGCLETRGRGAGGYWAEPTRSPSVHRERLE